MTTRTISMFEDQRLTLEDSLDLTRQSLLAYGVDHRHWAIAYSGGKDSSATLAAVVYLIETQQVPRPASLTVLYADTRQEIPPLHFGAMQMLETLRGKGYDARVVLPKLDDRYFVYMLGRGVPPPNNNTLRWCTPQIKVEPMVAALKALRDAHGEKFLMITGVRLGESAVRDGRIAMSCGRNGAECGQGWFQETTPADVADTLAPLLHWRVCHVWDFLTFGAMPKYTLYHGLPTQTVADVYGGDEAEEINARTGCIGCPLATKDAALDYVLSRPQWAYLAPLKQLRPLYVELRAFKHRKQKDAERNKGGELSKNPNRKGPLTLVAREWALGVVLGIQAEINTSAAQLDRPPIDLINAEEEARIRELIAARTYPNKWSDADPDATLLIAQTYNDGTRQELLKELESV
jgi:DNA sulfur modification protein DndC